MKTIIIGAAGLLLSGTALAAADLSKTDGGAAAWAPVASKDADGLGQSMIGNATLIDWPVKSGQVAPVTEVKAIDASAKSADATTDAMAKPMVEAAAAETPSTLAMSDKAIDQASLEMENGMGGPEETNAVIPATAPQASYPACSPGPGDDNCIQLYEPGVRASYAAWQAGYAPGTVQTAMGGPLEEVDGAKVIPAAASGDYPPCRSRGDDRCIQLYERGVSDQLAMGGPEERVDVALATEEGDQLAAYDAPLAEDLVMPAEELAEADLATDEAGETVAL